ncbi:endolytic transglycosylase MltG [Actinorugispora endophytica]|uniref:Endolytic murein transglycosylase n=1 Tax=Actinorugispora endophytica TaxID=1605990 RepID=A0A4R6UH91_9ACTN|nr:endolytic transglycosylase MltG [Actinorugispora endophytica]TDQ45396.1 UPF0755 protein [Actinorugispora endophytica]
MNGNDRYNDAPRRPRRPDPLADPWPVRKEAEERRGEARHSGHDGRGYRDERGVGHRQRAERPPAGNGFRESAVPPAPPGTGPGEPADTDRPRGRRRRPGPADTGSFQVPASGYEALDERPRGRRRKPDSEDAPPTPYNGFETTERSPGRQSRGTAVPEPADRAPARDLDEAPPLRPRRSHRPAPDPEPEEERPRGSRPARGPDLDEEPARRPRRAPEPDEDEEADAFALPFDDEDDEDERPSRSRGGRGRGSGGRRSGGKRKRKKSKAALMGALLVLTLFVGVAGIGGYTLLRAYVIPPDYSGEGSGEVDVVIEDGDSGTAIAQKLEEAGVIASVRAFTNEIRFSETNFTPGTYRLREQMSAEAAITLLLAPGTRVGIQVTIREGLRSTTILEELAEQTEIPLEEFQAAYQDTEALGLPEYATAGPEGYLYPETYTFDLDASAADILKQMVVQYKRVAAEVELEERAEAAGLTPNEVMSIAAIVQAETGGVEDMGKISRVVYNRLEIDMYLKMDSTCFYALGEYGIAINLDQQERCKVDESGYDTYFHEGLPVGPIGSPGKDAIKAALEPEEGEWLFFVATDPENGVTEFAETEQEFLNLVEKFNQSQD